MQIASFLLSRAWLLTFFPVVVSSLCRSSEAQVVKVALLVQFLTSFVCENEGTQWSTGDRFCAQSLTINRPFSISPCCWAHVRSSMDNLVTTTKIADRSMTRMLQARSQDPLDNILPTTLVSNHTAGSTRSSNNNLTGSSTIHMEVASTREAATRTRTRISP